MNERWANCGVSKKHSEATQKGQVLVPIKKAPDGLQAAVYVSKVVRHI